MREFKHKHKFAILLTGIILVSFFAYKRSFKKTINTFNKSKILEKQLIHIKSKLKDKKQLIKYSQFLDSQIGSEQKSPDIVQLNILDKISDFQNVGIYDLKKIHKTTDETFNIYTYQLTLVGDFNELISIIYNFEKKFKTAHLVSIKFFTQKNYKTHKTKLFLNLIFQSYEKI